MHAIVLDEREIASLIERRRETGADRYDEVWDGVYVMAPLATNEHQRLGKSGSRVGPGTSQCPTRVGAYFLAS